MTKLEVYLDQETFELLTKIAKIKGSTKSGLARQLIKVYLAKFRK